MKLDTYTSLAVKSLGNTTQSTIAQSPLNISKPLKYFGQVSITNEPAEGDPSKAKVVIVEFGDFECPFCAQTRQLIKSMQNRYGDGVAFVFKDFPLSSIHPRALDAAQAAHCAGDQGKYWEMHDSLFADQKHLEIDDLKNKSQELGLDTNKFNECLMSEKYKKSILANVKEGEKLMINGTPLIIGTPTLIINGYYVDPNELVASVDKFMAEGAK
jgi:protein-disulfide isomerase